MSSVSTVVPRSLDSDIYPFIRDLVKGKDVLDVGCAQHFAENESNPRWLHKHINSAAKATTGLELLETEAKKLRNKGYNVVTGDAVTVNLKHKFECIVAGEIIEHLENPGEFLRNMGRHLQPSGLLIITTPNPAFLKHQFEWFFFQSKLHERWNFEHVAWFDPFTLGNLLQRCSFAVEAIYYFTRSSKVLSAIRRLHITCPRLLASSFATLARPC